MVDLLVISDALTLTCPKIICFNFNARLDSYVQFNPPIYPSSAQITKILGSTSIRYRSDTYSLDRCPVDVDPKVFAVCVTWWRHQMETFSALLAPCAGKSPVPAQRPVTLSFDVFFGLRLNKWLSKQWWGWWFETPSYPLWRHSNDKPRRSYIHQTYQIRQEPWRRWWLQAYIPYPPPPTHCEASSMPQSIRHTRHRIRRHCWILVSSIICNAMWSTMVVCTKSVPLEF